MPIYVLLLVIEWLNSWSSETHKFVTINYNMYVCVYVCMYVLNIEIWSNKSVFSVQDVYKNRSRFHMMWKDGVQLQSSYTFKQCTRWRSWLSLCPRGPKFTGSIPDGVGIFHGLNPSGLTVTFGSSQPLTEKRPVRRADRISAFMWQFWEYEHCVTLRACPVLCREGVFL